MEVTASGSSDGGRPRRRGEAKAAAAVPACYLRPSAGSCHHVCKYGGAHAFEERDQPRRAAQPKPRKQPPAPAPAVVLGKLRSASSRRRVGDLISKPEKTGKKPVAAAGDDYTGKKDAAGDVVWKDIVAYDSPEKITVAGGDAKKKDVSVTKGKKSVKSSHGKGKIVAEQPDDDDAAATKKAADGTVKKKKKLIKSVGSKLTGKQPPSPEFEPSETATPPSDKTKSKKKMIMSNRTKSLKPPKPNKVLVEIGQEIVQKNSSPPPPPPSSSTAIKEEKPPHPLIQLQEDKSGKPAPQPPAHRRAKSMSITGTTTKSVRFPFTRQASKSSITFKVAGRSKSSRTTTAITSSPPEQQSPTPATTKTRLRFFRRGDAGGNSSGNGNGIQLRMRSLRRRGSSCSGGTTAATGGFVVPTVALRHQKTLEKKRSRRLYNSVIEETAGKLVKARKSKVKALVGAFESLISKIGK